MSLLLIFKQTLSFTLPIAKYKTGLQTDAAPDETAIGFGCCCSRFVGDRCKGITRHCITSDPSSTPQM